VHIESVCAEVGWSGRGRDESMCKLVQKQPHALRSRLIAGLYHWKLVHARMLRRRHRNLQDGANHAPIQIPVLLELLVHFGGNLDEERYM